MTTRIGDWMQLASGRRFYPLDPRPEDVTIDDIGHALSNVCRFGGHARVFYSVAQHSVLVSRACNSGVALQGLLHDAAEAFVGDLVRPLKHDPSMRAYREIEQEVHVAICDRFGISSTIPDSVKRADEVLLATEARDVMGGESAGKWMLHATPLAGVIVPFDPETARLLFLKRFEELTQGRNAA